jgi:hypothetical protein
MLMQFPRYLKAFEVRISRAFSSPARYREHRTLLSGYVRRFEELLGEQQALREKGKPTLLFEIREAIEELAISFFAQQEVGTRYRISTKRLDQALSRLDDNTLKFK